MIDRRKVIKDESKSALKLLSELPCHGQRRGGVVQDVTDKMQSSELARNWRAINDKRSNNDIGNLGMVALLRSGRKVHEYVKQIPHSMLPRAPN